jgi:hypothetical protein
VRVRPPARSRMTSTSAGRDRNGIAAPFFSLGLRGEIATREGDAQRRGHDRQVDRIEPATSSPLRRRRSPPRWPPAHDAICQTRTLAAPGAPRADATAAPGAPRADATAAPGAPRADATVHISGLRAGRASRPG